MIVACIAMIFPYFQLMGDFRGIQPYVTIVLSLSFLSCLLITLEKRPPYYIFIIPSAFIFVSLLLDNKLDILFLRNFFSYLNFCFVFFIFSVYFQRYTFPKKLFYYSLLIWILAAFLQLFFGEKIFSSLIVASTTSSRGATSFATEPSFFGLQLCMLLTILYLNDNKFKTRSYLLLGFIGLLLSMSIISAYFYACTYLAALIAKKQLRINYVIYAILGLAFITLILIDQRFGNIIIGIYEQGFIEFIKGDSSGSKRIFGAITPFILSFHNLFLPLVDPIQSINDFNCTICRNDMKISSFLGNFIFHFGFLFIVIFIFIFLIQKNLRNVTVLFFLSLFLLVEIPVAHPLVPLLILSLFKKQDYKLS